jgi:hypothetical protein
MEWLLRAALSPMHMFNAAAATQSSNAGRYLVEAGGLAEVPRTIDSPFGDDTPSEMGIGGCDREDAQLSRLTGRCAVPDEVRRLRRRMTARQGVTPANLESCAMSRVPAGAASTRQLSM